MATSKALKDAAAEATKTVTEAFVDKIGEVAAETVSAKSDPMAKLAAMASEYQTVNVKIYRIDENNLKKESLFTELTDYSILDVTGLQPDSLCRREGGGGLWRVVYQPPDGKGRTVITAAIRTEGRAQKIGTTDADREGVDKYTGLVKGGALPQLTAAQIGPPPASPMELLKTVQEVTKTSTDQANSQQQGLMALMATIFQSQQQKQAAEPARDPVRDEELRLMRQQNERMMDELRAMRETQAKAQADAQMSTLQTQIRALQEQILESQKNTQVKLLEAKIEKLADKPAIDPTIGLLTAVLGNTREDAKSQMSLVLELIKNKPDETDRFAKVQDMLMQSAMTQVNMVQQLAAAQGGPSSPAVEITRTIAEVAAQWFGSRMVDGEEEEAEEPEVAQLAGIEQPRQLAAPQVEAQGPAVAEGEQQEEPEPEEGEEEMLDITKIHEEFQAQVEQWMAGEPLPEVGPDGDRIAFSEKELETAIATSSIDSAIRLLALKKKPVPEITSRLFALAEDNHPIATHWFQHPLPATFQIMVHWDKRHNLGATKRIADLATDIVQHWMWVSEPDENGQQRDPYGRSSYRPPKAAAGVEQRVHGVTTQGKTVTTALGHKQEEQK